ncbi:cytochrome P450 [Phenylobacterium sp.]|jgi:fatty-acid peroxygenase|uniref:cytochrome P450 n=1 Tax=Phenylobacterium sp. TaxID=1871053 RepID=UPI002F92DBDD
MAGPPRERTLDATLALLREGYGFMARRQAALGSDSFRTRLMGGQDVLCIKGEAAAEFFYAPDRFTRKGALPPTTLLSLQDLGSVQRLDGSAHRWRKRLFLQVLSPPAVTRLGDLFDAEWDARAALWRERGEATLYVEMGQVLTRAVCTWGGSPLGDHEAGRRAAEFQAMIEGAGAVGPRNWKGLALRSRTERWARRQVADARAGTHADSPLAAVAFHRDEAGELLPERTAAVEYLNLLRPTVAVDRFVVFCAMALHDQPEWRERLAGADGATYAAFAQEVRRFYPFFPAVGGRALQPFEWQGKRFKRGAWVLLDTHGTNRDPRAWREPERFDPGRFLRDEANAFNFCPQGAGDVSTGHRCPGEAAVVELMARATRRLVAMAYEVPPQDLSIDAGRMPAIPKSRFVIRLGR